MRSNVMAWLVAGACAAAAPRAVLAADAPVAPVAPTASAAPAPRATSRGLAVLAVGDGSRVAWPLARAIYAREALRPSSLDEAHARVLAGEPPTPDALKDLTDLSETRAAIHGDDAPSRQLLASIATALRVRGIVVVVTSPDVPPQARVFVAESTTFDAARYAPEGSDGGDPDWSAAVVSLERAYGLVAQRTPAPPLATQPVPPENGSKGKEGDKDAGSRPFYASPWFWGAIGAAALGGTALYFATRDNTPSTIHLQLQVPK